MSERAARPKKHSAPREVTEGELIAGAINRLSDTLRELFQSRDGELEKHRHGKTIESQLASTLQLERIGDLIALHLPPNRRPGYKTPFDEITESLGRKKGREPSEKMSS